MVEPIDGVRLSVTIRGMQSEVHRVSAYRCSQWHIFTLIAPVGSQAPDFTASEEGVVLR